MPVSDNDLIERIRKGGKHYYALLVDRYKDRALTLAIRMLRNHEDAEEAVQDAFVRSYNALDRFEGKARFGTWLYRIVYNVCLTRLGKQKDEFQMVDYEDGEEYYIGETNSLMDQIESQDLMDAVRQIITTLPPKYATILTLFYFQDLSHEEIGEITQLPVGTIKTHLFRARNLLQQELKHQLQLESVV